MGYSRSITAITPLIRLLEDMLAAKGKYEVSWQSGNPQKLSRQLREAMTSAVINRENPSVGQYADLIRDYKICVRGNLVIAKPRVEGVLDAMKRSVKGKYEHVQTANQAIQAFIIETHVDELVFVNFIRDELELEALSAWATKSGNDVIDHGPSLGVTIVRKRSD